MKMRPNQMANWCYARSLFKSFIKAAQVPGTVVMHRNQYMSHSDFSVTDTALMIQVNSVSMPVLIADPAVDDLDFNTSEYENQFRRDFVLLRPVPF